MTEDEKLQRVIAEARHNEIAQLLRELIAAVKELVSSELKEQKTENGKD